MWSTCHPRLGSPTPKPPIQKVIVEVFLENLEIMAWCPILLKYYNVKNIILKKLRFSKLLMNIKVNGSCYHHRCKKKTVRFFILFQATHSLLANIFPVH
jgi:hypothetical protein